MSSGETGGGGGLLNTYSDLLYTAHLNTCHVLLLLLTVPMYTTHMPCLAEWSTIPMYSTHIAIVYCTRVGSATASFIDLVTVAQKNTANQL